MDFLRPIIARVIAGIIGGLATYVYAKWGYQIDQESQAAILSVLFTIFGIVYGVAHKTINSKINPVDAARPDTVVITKAAADSDTEAAKLEDVSNANVPHVGE